MIEYHWLQVACIKNSLALVMKTNEYYLMRQKSVVHYENVCFLHFGCIETHPELKVISLKSLNDFKHKVIFDVTRL